MRSLLLVVAMALAGCYSVRAETPPPGQYSDQPEELELWDDTCFWATWPSQPCQQST